MKEKMKKLACLMLMLLAVNVALAQESSGWTVNPHDYQYDMTVYGSLVVDGGTVTSLENYEIAAFVGDECRGVAEVQKKDAYTWLYIRVRSNAASGEKVTFKIYDKTAGKVYNAFETVAFTSNGQEGMPSSPAKLTLRRYTLGDVNDDGEIDVSDVQDLIDLVLSSEDLTSNPACDFNEDGEVDVSDIQSLIDYILNQ